MSNGTVAVVGSINIDLLLMVDRLPAAGETVLGTGGTLSPGGKGANQAVAAARQGATVLMVGAVGSDAHASEATRLLQDSGVSLDLVAAVEGPTGLAVVSVDSNAENSIVVIPGANNHVDSNMVAADLPRLRSCGVVVLQGELPLATTDFTVRELRDSEVLVVLNLAPVIPLSAESIRSADVLIVNEHEAIEALRLLSKEPQPQVGPEMHDADTVRSALALADSLVSAGVQSAVITLGACGAVVGETRGSVHVPPVAVDAVDTTGAGDAFVGAVAAGLAEGLSLHAAAELAVAVAAQSVISYGAQESYPWRTGSSPALS
ncbi:ribokinase [Arthrobacter sp.]|uniref:ribokinase n=1 Tax=Arthrobacter sp. TaxID=1667 RepID=UPI0028113622|nr:ribokinase [Arthrobacter sp.]